MGSNFPPNQSQNPFLADLYSHLPILVVRLTTDGLVLDINAQVTRVTGYPADELVGRNFWAVLFPGRLFAQIPRFISPLQPESLLRDYPLTLRTRQGQERIVAWTRFVRQDGGPGNHKEIVCLGQDLTDRLTDAERELAEQIKNGGGPLAHNTTSSTTSPAAPASPPAASASPASGAPEACESDNEAGVVTPLAVSPPAATGAGVHQAIQQLQEFLALADTRMSELSGSFTAGQAAMMTHLADALKSNPHAGGLLHFSCAVDRLHQAAHMGRLDAALLQLKEILALYQQETP